MEVGEVNGMSSNEYPQGEMVLLEFQLEALIINHRLTPSQDPNDGPILTDLPSSNH